MSGMTELPLWLGDGGAAYRVVTTTGIYHVTGVVQVHPRLMAPLVDFIGSSRTVTFTNNHLVLYVIEGT